MYPEIWGRVRDPKIEKRGKAFQARELNKVKRIKQEREESGDGN